MTKATFEREYFETYYRNYEAQNPRYKLEVYRRAIERHAPPGRLSLLDLGCGLGAFAGHLARHPRFRVAGTDLSRHAIEVNRERFPEVRFREAPATELPFEDHAFDVVTALDVIEHVPDLAAVAENVRRALRPRGLFVFVVPVYDGLSGPLIQRLDKDPTHVHKRERSFWTRWAREQGFAVEEWFGILRYLLPGGFYLHWPMRWARGHTPAILVVARAPEA